MFVCLFVYLPNPSRRLKVIGQLFFFDESLEFHFEKSCASNEADLLGIVFWDKFVFQLLERIVMLNKLFVLSDICLSQIFFCRNLLHVFMRKVLEAEKGHILVRFLWKVAIECLHGGLCRSGCFSCQARAFAKLSQNAIHIPKPKIDILIKTSKMLKKQKSNYRYFWILWKLILEELGQNATHHSYAWIPVFESRMLFEIWKPNLVFYVGGSPPTPIDRSRQTKSKYTYTWNWSFQWQLVKPYLSPRFVYATIA